MIKKIKIENKNESNNNIEIINDEIGIISNNQKIISENSISTLFIKIRKNYTIQLKEKFQSYYANQESTLPFFIKRFNFEALAKRVENASYFMYVKIDLVKYHENLKSLIQFWLPKLGFCPSFLVSLNPIILENIYNNVNFISNNNTTINEETNFQNELSSIKSNIQDIFQWKKLSYNIFCNNKNCKTSQFIVPEPTMQMNANDEGTTHFYRCTNCGQKFKLRG